MITTSPNVQGRLGLIAAGLGDVLVPTPAKCGGGGRACKPSCASPKRRPNSVVRGGCGCSGLAGLGEDLIDYGFDYGYVPMSVGVDAKVVPIQTISSPVSQTLDLPKQTNPVLTWSDISTSATVPPVQTKNAIYRQTGGQPDDGESGSMWPLFLLGGVAFIALMAN